jgi:hypothetical protein
MPRFIMASLPDLSQDQGGENFTCPAPNALNFPELTSRLGLVETRSLRSLNTLTSITSSEVFGTSEGSSFYPEPRP